MLPLAQAAAEQPQPAAPQEHEVVYQEALDKLVSLQFDLTQDQWIAVGVGFGMRVALVLVLLTLAWTLAGWMSGLVRSSLRRLKFDETLTLFLAKLTWWGILLLAALACLSKFGIETTSFAAVIGAAGLAIGLAFQGYTLQLRRRGRCCWCSGHSRWATS